jgi:hypothetical protein
MTQLGTDPRTAATQLQAFYSQVLKISSPMQEKAESLGLGDIYDEMGRRLTSGNLLGALKILRGLDPMTIANLFPNVRAVRAILALVEKGGIRVQGVFQRMGHSAGSSKKAFAAYSQTSKHHMEQLSASIEALKIAFGQGLAPVVSKAAEALAKKFANPQFVEKVRRLGFLIGTTLYQSFLHLKSWFDEYGPGILAWINGFAKAVGKIAGALMWLDKHKGPSGKDILSGKFAGPAEKGPGSFGGRKAQAGPHNTHVTVYLDTGEVAGATEKRLQRKGKSNSGSRRGRYGGQGLGLAHH